MFLPVTLQVSGINKFLNPSSHQNYVLFEFDFNFSCFYIIYMNSVLWYYHIMYSLQAFLRVSSDFSYSLLPFAYTYTALWMASRNQLTPLFTSFNCCTSVCVLKCQISVFYNMALSKWSDYF